MAEKKKSISVERSEDQRPLKGRLAMWGKSLVQINGKEDGQYLLGTKHTNIGLEPQFTPDNKEVFYMVEIV